MLKIDYEVATDHKANIDKSTVSFNKGVVDSKKLSIVGFWGVNVVDIHDRYLVFLWWWENQRRCLLRVLK